MCDSNDNAPCFFLSLALSLSFYFLELKVYTVYILPLSLLPFDAHFFPFFLYFRLACFFLPVSFLYWFLPLCTPRVNTFRSKVYTLLSQRVMAIFERFPSSLFFLFLFLFSNIASNRSKEVKCSINRCWAEIAKTAYVRLLWQRASYIFPCILLEWHNFYLFSFFFLSFSSTNYVPRWKSIKWYIRVYDFHLLDCDVTFFPALFPFNFVYRKLHLSYRTYAYNKYISFSRCFLFYVQRYFLYFYQFENITNKFNAVVSKIIT